MGGDQTLRQLFASGEPFWSLTVFSVKQIIPLTTLFVVDGCFVFSKEIV